MGFKGFTRYYRDLAFRAAIDEQLAFAASAAVPGSWITYSIHDPTRADEIAAHPAGLAIYVGQTKQFPNRVRKRLVEAGRATSRPKDRIDGACYDIMCKGVAPRFVVRDIVTSAIASLVSETNWAKKLIAEGYPLLNQWTEQKFAGLEIDRYTVPHDWLWPITAADAVGSEIDVIVRDLASDQEMILDLSAFPETMRLREIRAHVKEVGGRRLRLHVRQTSAS